MIKHLLLNSYTMSDIVVYTAITNNYDILKEAPIEIQSGVDFVAFLDSDQIATSWQIRKANSEFADPCRNAKRYKILPHIYFPEETYSLWIDGSVQIDFKFPIERLIDEYLKESDLAVFKHPERRCIYEEADACIRQGKDNPEIILRQIAEYRNEGYPPDNGLCECAVLLRRHTEKIRQFNEAWYQEIKNHSRRDQLSFNYVAHKIGLKFCHFPGSLRDRSNNLFHILPHQAEELAKRAEDLRKKTEDLATKAADLAKMARLQRRRLRVGGFALGFAILAFAWIATGLVLTFGDEELRPAFRIFWQLWPLVFILLCCAGVCWFWRSSLIRRIKELESRIHG